MVQLVLCLQNWREKPHFTDCFVYLHLSLTQQSVHTWKSVSCMKHMKSEWGWYVSRRQVGCEPQLRVRSVNFNPDFCTQTGGCLSRSEPSTVHDKSSTKAESRIPSTTIFQMNNWEDKREDKFLTIWTQRVVTSWRPLHPPLSRTFSPIKNYEVGQFKTEVRTCESTSAGWYDLIMSLQSKRLHWAPLISKLNQSFSCVPCHNAEEFLSLYLSPKVQSAEAMSLVCSAPQKSFHLHIIAFVVQAVPHSTPTTRHFPLDIDNSALCISLSSICQCQGVQSISTFYLCTLSVTTCQFATAGLKRSSVRTTQNCFFFCIFFWRNSLKPAPRKTVRLRWVLPRKTKKSVVQMQTDSAWMYEKLCLKSTVNLKFGSQFWYDLMFENRKILEK